MAQSMIYEEVEQPQSSDSHKEDAPLEKRPRLTMRFLYKLIQKLQEENRLLEGRVAELEKLLEKFHPNGREEAAAAAMEPAVLTARTNEVEAAPDVSEQEPAAPEQPPVVLQQEAEALEQQPVVLQQEPETSEQPLIVLQQEPEAAEQAPVVLHQEPELSELASLVLGHTPEAIEQASDASDAQLEFSTDSAQSRLIPRSLRHPKKQKKSALMGLLSHLAPFRT